MYGFNMMKDKITRKNIKLNYIKKTDTYTLDVEYEVEDDKEIKTLKLEGVNLNELFPQKYIRGIKGGLHSIYEDRYSLSYDISYVDDLIMDKMTLKIIETKTKEMTLEEIEKELGHKIKLISKKEDFKSVDSSLGAKYYGTPGWNNNNMKCNCVEDDCK